MQTEVQVDAFIDHTLTRQPSSFSLFHADEQGIVLTTSEGTYD